MLSNLSNGEISVGSLIISPNTMEWEFDGVFDKRISQQTLSLNIYTAKRPFIINGYGFYIRILVYFEKVIEVKLIAAENFYVKKEWSEIKVNREVKKMQNWLLKSLGAPTSEDAFCSEWVYSWGSVYAPIKANVLTEPYILIEYKR